ncbi:MAG TPA: response regulator transcription factor [Bacillota bacterium]|nr:response regulator transcription factor [Bacillota bacterium]
MYKVLLVDDEPYVIEGLKEMIDWEKRGYQICGEASNGEDAFQMIQDFDPDLVITDIRMPAMDGLQLIQQTREGGNSKVQFIILSGYDDFSYIQYAMKFGITDYLLKPIDDEEIRTTLDRIQGAYTHSKGPVKEWIPALEAPAREDKFAKNQEPETLSRQLAALANQGPGSENFVKQVKLLLNIADTQEIRCLLLEIDSYAAWMDTLEESEIHDKKMELKTLLLESLPEAYQGRLFEAEVHQFALIVSPQMEIYHQLWEYLANLRVVSKQRCNCSISVAVSEAMPGLGSLGVLYRQAALAIHYKFFHGVDSVIYFSDIKNTPLNDSFCNIPLDQLLEDIKNNDGPGIHEKIGNLFQDFARNLCTPEVIKAYLQNLLLEVIKHSLRLNGDIGAISIQIMKLNERLEAGSAPTIGALQADFEELCEHAAFYLSAIDTCNSQNIISAVKNYVKENYAKDISLQKLAKHFYMNPVYLGQLFKRCEGRQFSEYLHQTRIDEAKKLLRRTNMKISEIAFAIGYHDPEYFVSKFKSITQVPPSAFKKS